MSVRSVAEEPCGSVRTLDTALREAASVDRVGFTFLSAGLEARDRTWSDFVAEAERRGRRLVALGLGKGDRVALLLNDEEQFILTFLGAVAFGIVAVPMCPPSPLGYQRIQRERAATILDRSSACWIIGDRSAEGLLAALAAESRHVRGVTHVEDLIGESSGAACPRPERPSIEPDDLCFLQFTSGSTGEPKGVMVTHRSLVANYTALHAYLGTTPEREVGVNWVPLYHDLGLIGSVVFPLLAKAHQVFIPTLTFAVRPQVWLEVVHRYRGTMLSTNNFGLRVATRRKPKVERLDLGCVRVIHVGSEPIHPDTVEQFARTFAAHGLSPSAINPAYGMAEATLAVTASRPSEPVRTLDVDARAYELGRIESVAAPKQGGSDTRRIVSCGFALPGTEIRIVDDEGQQVPEANVGEIWIRGASVTEGYFGDAGSTHRRDGWLRTGDLGFLIRGELFVSGRLKDLVIIAGRNYHPQEIEWAAARVSGVRPGQVVAFSVMEADTEHLIVVAECENPHRIGDLSRRVRVSLATETGIDPRDVLIVAPWSLPKTSSGKLQRVATKQAYLRGELQRIEATAPSGFVGSNDELV